jgi:methionyl-tRNA formyltransferase
MRVVFLGSGAFGLPTLRALHATHEMPLIVSQPDRPAGRRRVLTATPVAAWAEAHRIPLMRPDDVNDAAIVRAIHASDADAIVVIAYGQKLGTELLDGQFAVNLHGSLLPKYRGAAPITWAMIQGETETGVTVITLAQRMDAGAVLATRATAIDPRETAGELHDRLATLGPDAVLEVLDKHERGTLRPAPQDETLATRAPKLTKADGTTGFDQPAALVRCRVHGLTPWPGCRVRLGDDTLRLLRVEVADTETPSDAPPGTLDPDGTVICRPGRLRLLEVQPPGGRAMPFEAFARGHRFDPSARLEPLDPG